MFAWVRTRAPPHRARPVNVERRRAVGRRWRFDRAGFLSDGPRPTTTGRRVVQADQSRAIARATAVYAYRTCLHGQNASAAPPKAHHKTPRRAGRARPTEDNGPGERVLRKMTGREGPLTRRRQIGEIRRSIPATPGKRPPDRGDSFKTPRLGGYCGGTHLRSATIGCRWIQSGNPP